MSSDRILLLLLMLIAGLPAFAQDALEADAARIEQAVKAAEAEARAFALDVARRAEAYAEEASELSDTVLARRYGSDVPSATGTVDFAGILEGAGRIADVRESEPAPAGVIVLASFSMPEASLRELVTDAHRAGVPVMLRGFAGGSLSETAKRMRALLARAPENASGGAEDFLGGVVIDPRAFRIFGVEDVPVFIASAAPLPDCDGLSCTAPPPPHDRIAGNMSLAAALRALASEGTHAPRQAEAALRRLEARP